MGACIIFVWNAALKGKHSSQMLFHNPSGCIFQIVCPGFATLRFDDAFYAHGTISGAGIHSSSLITTCTSDAASVSSDTGAGASAP
eukprot:6460990-Amphidinium_carterae.1